MFRARQHNQEPSQWHHSALYKRWIETECTFIWHKLTTAIPLAAPKGCYESCTRASKGHISMHKWDTHIQSAKLTMIVNTVHSITNSTLCCVLFSSQECTAFTTIMVYVPYLCFKCWPFLSFGQLSFQWTASKLVSRFYLSMLQNQRYRKFSYT